MSRAIVKQVYVSHFANYHHTLVASADSYNTTLIALSKQVDNTALISNIIILDGRHVNILQHHSFKG